MPHWKTVAIVGVGLIGGSIGLGLRTRHLASTVVGIGRRAESLETARRVGAISDATLDLAAGVHAADLIVVCTPVQLIVEHVIEAARHCPAGALITDAGSTKGSIVTRLDAVLDPQVRFVGSHPLAGSEKQGPAQANADLLVDRTVVVTPTARTRPQDRDDVEAFWTALGARVVRLSPAEHDRALAETSHLPHLVAAALANSVATTNHRLSAGGFRDTTRIAAGDPELWAQILLDNRAHVLAALEPFERSVAALRQSLETSDLWELTRILRQAKNKRDALGS
jgi:prephenate dehydrogenase